MAVTGGFDTPHLKFPYSRPTAPGGPSYVEQGSDEHAQSRAQVVIACPTGWRNERPEFGWHFPTFENAPLDTTSLMAALEQFADVEVDSINEYADAVDAAIRHMDVFLRSSGDESG